MAVFLPIRTLHHGVDERGHVGLPRAHARGRVLAHGAGWGDPRDRGEPRTFDVLVELVRAADVPPSVRSICRCARRTFSAKRSITLSNGTTATTAPPSASPAAVKRRYVKSAIGEWVPR